MTVPSVPKPPFVQVVTPVLIVRSSWPARTFSVVVDVIAYRKEPAPAFVTVIGAVTWSPGIIAEKVTSADAGLVEMSIVPVLNVLAATA